MNTLPFDLWKNYDVTRYFSFSISVDILLLCQWIYTYFLKPQVWEEKPNIMVSIGVKNLSMSHYW